MAERDEFTRTWIIQNALQVIKGYDKGVLTIRGLHYRLVSLGMFNTVQHYKRVVKAMIEARWEGLVDFDTFSDHDREMIGRTQYERVDLEEKIEEGKEQIKSWMEYFNRNRWENQKNYVEVLIEKKALQGVFEPITRRKRVTLGACKGYPSLTFLYESAGRFNEAISAGFNPIILYFGDYDPSGEDIPRSIGENMERLGVPGIEVRRIALMENQVIEWKLPPAPVKEGDTRSAAWDGLGQVELDAVDPNLLQELARNAIDSVFDEDIYDDLVKEEGEQREIYISRLKDFVQTL